MTGGWRILHNQELHDLYSSPNIIRIILSRWMNTDGKIGTPEGKETVRKAKT
jgi:hypothetical protein